MLTMFINWKSGSFVHFSPEARSVTAAFAFAGKPFTSGSETSLENLLFSFDGSSHSPRSPFFAW